jgi:hypothetical protein
MAATPAALGPGSLIPRASIARTQEAGSGPAGPNALGEVLEPGRVADCYLGLLLPPGSAGQPEAGTILIVAPAALLHPRVPQPDGSLVYELLTGHPEREAGELVFVADLTGELRAWPADTWATWSASTPTRSPRRSLAAGATAR